LHEWGYAAERLANAFDECADAGFGRLKEQFGRGESLPQPVAVLTRFAQKRVVLTEPSSARPASWLFSRCVCPNLAKC